MNACQMIRVLCVDDHDFIHDGLKARFTLERDLECVAHASTADDLAGLVHRSRPDIVLLDIDMPGSDPFAALRDLREQHPDVRAIMLSAYVRDHYIDDAVDKGAWGYFSKSDTPDDLVAGIRRVADGHMAFGPSVRERFERGGADEAAAADRGTRLERLTGRELEVLRLIGRGLSRADIAQMLHRSLKTVDAHHTSIMKKLDIHDRVELALYAVREGLVEER
jgi:DNA-binding NarL/FixJ family response regulator